jgi:hypothetical protein
MGAADLHVLHSCRSTRARAIIGAKRPQVQILSPRQSLFAGQGPPSEGSSSSLGSLSGFSVITESSKTPSTRSRSPPGVVASVEAQAVRAGSAEEAGRVRRPRATRPHVDRSAFAGFRFPPEVTTVAVRWYLRYGLSYRDVEEVLAERGVEVDHVTVYRWVQRFTPLFADRRRVALPVPGGRPVRASHRRAAVRAAGQRRRAPVVRPRTHPWAFAGRGDHGQGRPALMQNLRRGHYELATDVSPPLRLAAAFSELALAM